MAYIRKLLILIRAIKGQILDYSTVRTKRDAHNDPNSQFTTMQPAIEPPTREPELAEPKHKARSLEDILLEFGSIDKVSYKPIQVEPKRPAKALLPTTFSTHSHPYDYFTLFFTPDLFQQITTNTNRYANIKRIHSVEEGQREWTDLLVEELYVFIGAIIYMGIHEEPNIPMYWNTDFNKGPLHSLPNHISLRQFEQIKRYCHISCPDSDQRKGYNLSSNKI